MNIKTLKAAIQEAKRFSEKAEKLLDECQPSKGHTGQAPESIHRASRKTRAAVRRSSLDLTRSLAELRHPLSQ